MARSDRGYPQIKTAKFDELALRINADAIRFIYKFINTNYEKNCSFILPVANLEKLGSAVVVRGE
jgi:hypothetical protein